MYRDIDDVVFPSSERIRGQKNTAASLFNTFNIFIGHPGLIFHLEIDWFGFHWRQDEIDLICIPPKKQGAGDCHEVSTYDIFHQLALENRVLHPLTTPGERIGNTIHPGMQDVIKKRVTEINFFPLLECWKNGTQGFNGKGIGKNVFKNGTGKGNDKKAA
jgi:hypothetical protein